jgi:hypothetical protein
LISEASGKYEGISRSDNPAFRNYRKLEAMYDEVNELKQEDDEKDELVGSVGVECQRQETNGEREQRDDSGKEVGQRVIVRTRWQRKEG